MTIYRCRVAGCNSNNKINSELRFFVLPKVEERAKLWIKATCQDDLLVDLASLLNTKWRNKFRVCSLHFLPTSMRNQRLADDAVPRLNLPSQSEEIKSHHGVACNVCNTIISSYRYKCIVCDDYDLCEKCEKSEDHNHHYLIRIVKPLFSAEVKSMINNLKSVLYPNTVDHKVKLSQSLEGPIDCDSDDEPITKYQRNNDSTLQLSSDTRNKITNEVNRVLKLINRKRKSIEDNESVKIVKKIKKNMPTIGAQTSVDSESLSESAHEVEFADVNDFKNEKPVEVTLEEESEVLKTVMDTMLYTMLS